MGYMLRSVGSSVVDHGDKSQVLPRLLQVEICVSRKSLFSNSPIVE